MEPHKTTFYALFSLKSDDEVDELLKLTTDTKDIFEELKGVLREGLCSFSGDEKTKDLVLDDTLWEAAPCKPAETVNILFDDLLMVEVDLQVQPGGQDELMVYHFCDEWMTLDSYRLQMVTRSASVLLEAVMEDIAKSCIAVKDSTLFARFLGNLHQTGGMFTSWDYTLLSCCLSGLSVDAISEDERL